MVINNNNTAGMDHRLGLHLAAATAANFQTIQNNHHDYYYYNGYRNRTTDRNGCECNDHPAKVKHKNVTNAPRANVVHCQRPHNATPSSKDELLLKINKTQNEQCVRAHSIANRRGAIKQQK